MDALTPLNVTLALLTAGLLYIVYRIVAFAYSDCDAAVAAALASMPTDAFKDKTVWITGASSGIGEALAYAVASRGGAVIVSARRMDRLASVVVRCRDAGARDALAIKLDVEDFNSHAGIAAHVFSKFPRVDYFVNNAGRSQRGLIDATPLSVDVAMFNLNFFGSVSITKAVLPYLVSQGGGMIVNTSSVAGKIGSPCSATYAATKGAMQLYFDSLRMEMADRGIGVCNVCPGPVRSEITMHAFTETPGKEVGHPTEDAIHRVSAERCGELMAAAMHARLPEMWVSPQPILFYLYVGQYAPALYHMMAPNAGKKRVAAFRAGQRGYDSVQSPWGVMFGGGGSSSAAPAAPQADKRD